MNRGASPARSDRLEQLREERSIESDLVSGHMNNDDPERQRLEIVLVLESAIGGDEHITLQALHEHMVFQVLPAEIEKGLDLMVRERFDQPWIDGGVYNDAHAS
jgi:hypothetical protein